MVATSGSSLWIKSFLYRSQPLISALLGAAKYFPIYRICPLQSGQVTTGLDEEKCDGQIAFLNDLRQLKQPQAW